MVAQVPLGCLADRVGGPRVMLASLVAWSLVAAATPVVAAARHGARFALLVGARVALGLCQSCLMPATSAMAAQCAVTRVCTHRLTATSKRSARL